MAEPTLKDVLEAIAGVSGRVERLESAVATKDDLAALRAETKADLTALRSETKTDLTALRSDMATKAEMRAGFDRVDARFDRVDKRLDGLDKDLDGHMKVHRELEKDIELLKRRPPRTAARAARRR